MIETTRECLCISCSVIMWDVFNSGFTDPLNCMGSDQQRSYQNSIGKPGNQPEDGIKICCLLQEQIPVIIFPG